MTEKIIKILKSGTLTVPKLLITHYKELNITDKELIILIYLINNDDLKDSYKKLISNIKGNSFLCSTINLFLLENSFRINGIDEADIEIYNKVVSDYNRQLDFNIQQFNEQEKAKKTK